MGHQVVKIISFEQQVYETKQDLSVWHYVDWVDDPRTLCGGIAYQCESKYIEKEVERGGITCKECLKIIKKFKKIKL